jgi:hypothetical protein
VKGKIRAIEAGADDFRSRSTNLCARPNPFPAQGKKLERSARHGGKCYL